MTHYELIGAIITLAALTGYANVKTLKLPTSIALMGGALIASMCLILSAHTSFFSLERNVEQILAQFDFRDFLLNGILNLLLFAGALEVNLNDLFDAKYEVGLLAFVATILSTILIAVGAYYLSAIVGVALPWLYCLLLGAIISPTDPIAVLAIFKQVGAPKLLHTTVSGESLFNDGVAIVIFSTLISLALNNEPLNFQSVSYLFMTLAIGGILFGVVIGIAGYYLIATIENPKLEILITLAIATGGYYLAQFIQVSGPLAMVSAGIFIGNQGRHFALSKSTVVLLDSFWEVIDELLNAILFFLIGAEILILPHAEHGFVMGLMMIPIILMVRAITVYVSLWGVSRGKAYPPYFKSIVIWGGLRGGLAVALALALPKSSYRDLILVITYCKVTFSILVQGLTVKPLVAKLNARQ